MFIPAIRRQDVLVFYKQSRVKTISVPLGCAAFQGCDTSCAAGQWPGADKMALMWRLVYMY